MHYFSLRNISIFSGMFLVFYGITTWMLLNLPGSSNMACVIGAYVTPINLITNLLLSFAIAATVVNMVEFSTKKSAFVSKSGVIGSALVFLTSFCASCTLPILASLGVGGFFSLISIYHGWFQILALSTCVYALVSSHKKVVNDCNICVL